MSVSRCETSSDPSPLELGRYRIEGPLGRGGMGVVYQGRDSRLGRVVAIKLLPERLSRDAESLARFEREARVLAGLHHPNIAAIHGVGRQPDGTSYLVLERVEGESLAAYLARGPLPVSEALDLGRQVARALVAAHEREVIHRDLKPSNVMRTPDGLAKVLDFGLARRIDDGASLAGAPADGAAAADPYTTLSGLAQGTPGYMSPEQILGETAGPAADVFSFGCLLHECLSGRRVFAGQRVADVLQATLDTEPDDATLPTTLPSATRDLLRRCLAKDPRGRPQAADLERELEGQGAEPLASAGAAVVRGLPESATRFIGREAELRQCLELLRRARLVTLTGAGGCGKTRLALEIAATFRPRERHAVWFCDLSTVGEGGRVADAVAGTLGVRQGSSGSIIEDLAMSLGEGPTFLVLDRCEHVLQAAAALAGELLARCPGLRVLATSREWLGVAGEQTYRVPPLSLPAPNLESDAEGALESESVRLFLDRAARSAADLALDPASLAAVSRLCRRLGGIPLAIELAAARARTSGVEGIDAQLGDRLSPAPGRGESNPSDLMDAAIGWSYERLDPVERRMLRGLAVFSGGATLDGATAVCGEGRDAFEVLDLLTGLTDQSLLATAAAEDHESRYRMLEPVREFALGELRSAREESEGRRRCLDYYLKLAETAAPHLPGGPRQSRWLASLESEHSNLLAALDWCEQAEAGATQALKLAGSCWRFWYIRGHFASGRRVLERALARPAAQGATAERALALFGAGGLAVFQGDAEAAEVFDRESLSIYERLGDRAGMARATVHLAVAADQRGDTDRARELYQRALGAYRELGEERGAATALNNLGGVERNQGDYRTAVGHWEAALELARRGGDLDTLALLLVNLALASSRLGEVAKARAWIAEGIDLVAKMGARRIATAALEVAVEVLAAGGALETSARLEGAAAALREQLRLPADAWWGSTHGAAVAGIRSRLGASFEMAWARGRRLSARDALSIAGQEVCT